MPDPLVILADVPPGGAALGQVLEATLVFAVVLGGLAWFVRRERRHGPSQGLPVRLARAVGVPVWAALPLQLLRLSLVVALFGMYWDISIHIDNGRDPGPLANPAHWFILFGLAGVFASGALSLGLARDPLPASSIRLTRTWRAPVGGALLLGCGAFSLLGFPLDDLWHRLFGQDVTLFGPTHLMLIGGATLATVGGWVLLVEAVQVAGRRSSWVRWGEYAVAGGFLVGLSTFQAEFDFGVPQFRFVLEPVMVMAAASTALVTARVRLGRGGALAACLSFLLLRSVITLLVAVPLGRSVAHFPTYAVEALLVEGLALAVGTARSRRFGLLAGAGIGTVGLAAEWGWSHVWAVLPWPAALLPEAVVLGLLAALGGGLIGSWLGTALQRTAGVPCPEPEPPALRALVPLGGLAVLGALAAAVPISAGAPVSAHVSLQQVTPDPHRSVLLHVRLRPPAAADRAAWFTATSWQGGSEVVDRLRPVGPGAWVSTRPVPVFGSWKTTLRLQRGSEVLGLPVYLPRDAAIPAPEVPALASFDRPFEPDRLLLQREQRPGVPGWLWSAAYAVVGLLAALALGAIGAGAAYAARGGGRATAPGASRQRERSPVPLG